MNAPLCEKRMVLPWAGDGADLGEEDLDEIDLEGTDLGGSQTCGASEPLLLHSGKRPGFGLFDAN